MKMRPAALLPLLPLLLAGCGDTPTAPSDPETAEGMYARSQELLKPSAEREGPDTAGAMRWLTKAAHAGHVPAMVDLAGIYYAGGKGVEEDPQKAFGWFSRAAELGHVQSLVFIGEMYYYGRGVKADAAKALAAWRKAAAAGVAEADFFLGDALLKNAATVPEAVEHFKIAATRIQGGLAARAATTLAGLYWHGYGPLEPDRQEAIRWYRHGAEAGDPQAQYIYAIMLIDGGLVPEDEARGFALLRMSAGQDHLPAIAQLINLLRNAEDSTPEMQQEAEAWQKRMDELQGRNP